MGFGCEISMAQKDACASKQDKTKQGKKRAGGCCEPMLSWGWWGWSRAGKVCQQKENWVREEAANCNSTRNYVPAKPTFSCLLASGPCGPQRWSRGNVGDPDSGYGRLRWHEPLTSATCYHVSSRHKWYYRSNASPSSGISVFHPTELRLKTAEVLRMVTAPLLLEKNPLQATAVMDSVEFWSSTRGAAAVSQQHQQSHWSDGLCIQHQQTSESGSQQAFAAACRKSNEMKIFVESFDHRSQKNSSFE